FFDDLRVVELGADAGAGEEPFCKSQPVLPGPKVLPGLSLYFASGSAVIRPEDQPQLDSLATQMTRHPTTVFEISGHTDTTGGNHLTLSTERIDSVLAYLRRNHGINPLRFVRVPSGDQVAREGSGISDLQLDRRVTILGADAYRERVLYRYVLEAIRDGHRMQAIKWLYVWLFLAPDREVLLAEYDPRLRGLLQHPALRGPFKDRRAKVYTTLDHKNGKPFLDSLWHEDQLTRTLNKYIENIFYYVPSLDSTATYWRVNFPTLSQEAYRQRDDTLATLAMRWLDKYGWPKISAVGKRAAKAIPLALIHSGDTTAITTYLPTFYARCREGEGEWGYYALLFDRNQIVRGLPQRYGTQFRRDPITGKKERFPVEDWAEMNRLRWEMGLGKVKQ
ncbi:MAG: OmpA family protein, partial [Bacteroidota bacterium]